MCKRFGPLALACGLALTVLWVGAQLLAGAGTALANGETPRNVAAPRRPDVDPRWLELVRSTSTASVGQAPTSVGPTIDYLITDQVLAGHVPLASTVVVSVTRAAHTLTTFSLTPFPDQGEFLYATSLAGPFNYLDFAGVQTGDVIWVMQASASVSLMVPVLNGLAWPQTDVVSGTAPANAALQLFLYPFSDPAGVYTRAATADGAGNYQSAWSPSVNIRPRDSGFVLYAPDGSHQTYARFVAPFLRAQVQGYGTDGLAAPNSDVIVSMASITGSVLGARWSRSDALGRFNACVEYCPYFGDNQPVYEPGQVVSATAAGQTFSLTVPILSVQANLAGGTLQGQAAPGQPLVVTRFAGPVTELIGDDGPPASQAAVTATAGGTYSVALPLAPRDYGEATVTDAQGNEAYARYAVPYLNAQLGDAFVFGYDIQGQLDDTPGPLTITVQGASGQLKGLRFARVGTTGYFIDPYRFYYGTFNPPNIALETGDQITLTTAHGVQLTYTIPLLTAQADVPSQTIFGQAPPGAAITINFSDVFTRASYSLVATATAQGAYTLDFAPLGHFSALASGSVAYTSPAGHTVTRNFQTRQACLPELDRVQVQGNVVQGSYYNKFGDAQCDATIIELRDAQGHTRYSESLRLFPGDSFFLPLANGDQPVIIQPGDHLSFSNQGQTLEYAIPSLSVALNAAAGTISGQAPPGAALTVDVVSQAWLRGYSSSLTIITTATAQGAYQVMAPLSAGEMVQVSLSGTPEFYAVGVTPIFKVNLYQSLIEGLAPPFSTFSVAIQTARPIATPLVTGTAGYFGQLFLSIGQPPSTFEPGDSGWLTTTAGTRSLVVPALTGQIDPTTGVVSGTAPAGARLLVFLNGGSPAQVVTATAQGRYQAVFGSAPFDTSGQVIYTSSAGDVAALAFNSARWTVTLDNACVDGYAPVPQATTTVTLTAPGGAVKGVTQVIPQFLEGKFTACFPHPVQGGDRLTQSGPDGLLAYTVPGLTASHNPARHWVIGSAPPGTLITFSLNDNRPGRPFAVTRQLIAGADGSFGLDVSDLQLAMGDTGSATVQDAQGDSVQRNFTINGLPTYFPLIGR